MELIAFVLVLELTNTFVVLLRSSPHALIIDTVFIVKALCNRSNVEGFGLCLIDLRPCAAVSIDRVQCIQVMPGRVIHNQFQLVHPHIALDRIADQPRIDKNDLTVVFGQRQQRRPTLQHVPSQSSKSCLAQVIDFV